MNKYIIGSIVLLVILLSTWAMIHNCTQYRVKFSSGNSMSPTIGHYSISVYQVVDNPDEIDPADVVVFENRRGNLVSHRFIRKNDKGQYIFRGDNNLGREYVGDFDKIKYKFEYHIISIGGDPGF